MRDLPSGTVTFLFTDIEGSTRLLREMGDAYADALAEHRRLLRDAFAHHGGFEVGTEGDAFFVVFRSTAEAAAAAAAGQAALESGPIRVRMGMHTGEPTIREGDYVGLDVHLAARIGACGHGGQVVLSAGTRALLGDGLRLLDLGEHRLKDFDDPVQLFQLGEGRFPPLRTISNTNLPRPASSFVGREREVSEVVSLLKNGARLVSLTGPGGSGKTRLAIEAAAELVQDFKAGVFWTGLAPLRDATLVSDAMAQTLGAKDGVAPHIGEREMLLLLDNFEQVVEAAPELSSLLAACPNLKLLVTSRERLRVQGEVEYPVPPLAEPEAVRLFCTRSHMEADETIAELCRRLDDLPLAVELAAARTSVLSPSQVLDRVSKRLDLLKGGRDADPLQATLRATIEWSYDLLSEEEKALFARLAVFVGGCSLESAEEVAEAGLDVLQSLVDKSLVRHTQERFWMLETIREYALERLEESGEAAESRRRHAGHFLALAEEAEPHLILIGRGADEWHDRLEREHDNIRAALDNLQRSGETEIALRLAGAIAEFWDQRAHHVEGQRWYEALLRSDERPTAARAKALNGATTMASKRGDMTTAKVWEEEALALHGALGGKRGIATSLWGLGYISLLEENFGKAEEQLNESVRLFREVGDDASLLWATRTLAYTYYTSGDIERARPLYEENYRRARALGDRSLEATMLSALSGIALDEGRISDAVSMRKESLRINREVNDPLLKMSAISAAAETLVSLGKATTAARLLACYEALCEETGTNVLWAARENEKTLAVTRSQLDEAAFAEAWEEGRTLTTDAAVALALDALE